IGRELVRRGIEVFAVVPLRGNQRPIEQLDGIHVLGFPARAPWQVARLLQEANADIYHSQEPSFTTHLAQRAMPGRKHLVTLRDTHEWSDWLAELRHPSLNRRQVLANKLFEDNPLVQRAVRRAHRLYCAAEFLRAKAQRKYRLRSIPEFLPTPVSVPDHIHKAERPTVCYLARWDRRKRPELFLALARKFPQIRFIAFGTSRDTEYERGLRARFAGLRNLEMPGHVDQFASGAVASALTESWILVNTAVREGLPNAFLEAAAHGCAILSAVDPDGFASRFGLKVEGDNFAAGLETLLQGDRWRGCGERGREHVRSTFELGTAIERHLAIYNELLAGESLPAESVP
ncbi:MAG: glycosyltransferase family 4 protein, partial [Gemmatimonadales bacterium]